MTHKNEICEWHEDPDGYWVTSRGHVFVLNEGPPSENGMAYCCYCGRRLQEFPIIEEEAKTDEN